MASLQGYNVEPGHFVAKPQCVSDVNLFSQVSQFLFGGISSCLSAITLHASVLGVKEGRKTVDLTFKYKDFHLFPALKTLHQIKRQNHTSNSNRGNFNIKKCLLVKSG